MEKYELNDNLVSWIPSWRIVLKDGDERTDNSLDRGL